MNFEISRLRADYDVLAPDGSEIRFLSRCDGGSTVHCALPPGGVSRAVRHRTVEECWYVLSGEGEVWRAGDGGDSVDAVCPGTALTIPLGAHFQFRNTGAAALQILIATIPPWPGEHEAVRVDDHWPIAG